MQPETWACDKIVGTWVDGERKWLVWAYNDHSPDPRLVATFERFEDAELCVNAVNAKGDDDGKQRTNEETD